MTKMFYKGCEITAEPQLQIDDGLWSTKVTISRYNGSGMITKEFHDGKTFKSEEEAIKHCLSLGQQIIDGGILV